MEMRKAVVLARGLGTRMRRPDRSAVQNAEQSAIADRGVKALIPVGRPFLDYVISALADAGLRDICLVIGPEHDLVRQRYERDLRLRRVAVRFAVQAEPRGTADALLAAEPFAGGDMVLVLNSDNLYPTESLRDLRALGGPAVAAFDRDALVAGGNIPPDRVRQFALLDIDRDGCLRRVLEKPDETAWTALAGSAPVGMNLWALGPPIFEACRMVSPSPRGELELPAAVNLAIDRLGERLSAPQFRLPVLDLSTRADIAAVQARLAGIEVDL
jgi:glucose-1-phosphate thymidylyltransferase